MLNGLPLVRRAIDVEMLDVGHNNTAMLFRPAKKLIFITLIFLTGCYKQPGAGQEPSGDVLIFAKHQLEAIRTRDFKGVESNLGPQFKSENVRELLERAADFFPAEEPKSVNLLAFIRSRDKSATDMAFEYAFTQKWFLVRISVVETNNGMIVGGFFINPVNMPVKDMLGMNWSRHGVIQYLFLGAAIIDPIFILAVLVLCIRTSIPKRKWLWLLFIAFGWMQMTLNWHTGAWKVNPLSIQFLGSGYFAPMLYDPIIWPLFITISVPLGAIIFLWKRKKYLESKSIPDQAVAAGKDESDRGAKI